MLKILERGISLSSVIIKNDFYAGYLYAKFWDPFMKSTRTVISKKVPGKSRVIDVASGTGHQLRVLASRIEYGVGLDLSDRMQRYAEKETLRRGYTNLSFALGDASDLSRFNNSRFDFSMATLLFHEVPREKRLPILLEMKRVSNAVIVTDYTADTNFSKRFVDFMEHTIGISHARHYKSYIENGGMNPLLAEAGLTPETFETAMAGTIGIWSCRQV